MKNSTLHQKSSILKKSMYFSIIIIAFLFNIKCFGQSITTYTPPSSYVDISTSGNSVTTPGNAYVSDNAYSIFDNNNDIVRYGSFSITAANGGIIPSDATINGISVRVEGNTSDRDVAISLSWDNAISFTSTKSITTFTTTDAFYSVGGSSDLWGRASWSVSELNNSNFWIKLDPISATTNLNIDLVQVKVYFSSPTVGYAAYESNSTFTVPAGVTSLTVECWGGGGRGGTTYGDAWGAGGGGGAYSSSILSPVTPGNTYTVTVGAGSSTTAAGGDSWFGSTSTVLAKGGNSGPTSSGVQTGATGGASANGVGTTKYSGGNGANGVNSTTDYGGGGGSSAGTGANGTTATNQNGATAPTGGGDGGAGRYSTDGAGTEGNSPGGGGGGALRNGGTNYNGGSGAPGQVIITWSTCTATITLGSNAPTAGDVCAGTLKHPIQSFSLAVSSGCDGNLTNVQFTTTGTYVQADISKYQLWYNNTNSISGATQVGTDLASSGGAGTRSFTTFSSPTLTGGTTYYFWITADIATGATNNNTIAVNAISTSDLTSTSTKDGSTSVGGTQTIQALPAAAGSITGSATVCQQQTGVAYSVGAIANATGYVWNYSGTGATINGTGNSITMDFSASATSGNLTVYGTNSCGNGTVSPNYGITVNTLSITATGATICAGGSGSLTASGTCSGGSPTTTSATDAGVGTNVPIGSNTDWLSTSLGNIVSNNNQYTTIDLGTNSYSDYLQGTSFSFSIPAGSTINGITLTIGRYAEQTFLGGTRIQDASVRLVKGGTVVGDENGNTGSDWPTSETPISYGGSSNLWGTTWTVADINASNFGAVLEIYNRSGFTAYTAYVDYMQITVTYTSVGSLNWYTQSSGGTIIHSGSSFNPVSSDFSEAERNAAGSPYTNLSNTNTPGTYPFWVECSTDNACRAKADFVIVAAPDYGTVQSGDETICSGDASNIGFSEAPSGSASFALQWYYQDGIVDCPTGTSTSGWTLIGGATGSAYDPPAGLTVSRTYAVTVDPTGSPDCSGPTWADGCRKVTVGPLSLTWDEGGNSSDWGAAANWNPDGVPISCTNVTIPDVSSMTYYPIVTTTDAVCNNLTIQPKGQLTVNNGATLTLSGTATINSDAIDSNGSLIVNGTLSGGQVTYNRYLNPNRWWIIGAPVNIASGFNSTYNEGRISNDNGSYDLAWYKEGNNEGWQYDWYTTGGLPSSLDNGRGYLMGTMGDGIVAFTGSLNHTDVSVPVTDTGDGRNGWNAVGNPFTSAILITGSSGFINLNSSILENNYATAYIWNETGLYNEWTDQYYRAINNSGYTFYDDYLGFGSPLNVTHVQAGQGFLVNAKVASGTVVFSESLQSHQNTLTLKSAATSWPGVTLTVSGGNQKRYTVVAFNDQMTTGLDKTYDVGLLASSDFILYTRLVKDDPGVDMEIQCLPETYSQLSVPVGINYPAGGQVTFKTAGVLLPQGIAPLLEDRLLGTVTPLKTPTDEYTVTLPKNTSGTGRFYLNFGNATSALQQAEAPSFSAFFAGGKIVISGVPRQGETAGLYDLQGRKLGEYPMLKIQRNEIPCSRLAAGVYMLRIGSQVMKIPVTKE